MTHDDIPEILSIQNMAKLLNLSRARFYSLISTSDASKCFFLPPIYCVENQRPYYNKEMAQKNIEIKRNCTGVNSKVLLFYNPRNAAVNLRLKINKSKAKQRNNVTDNRYTELREGLKSLGMNDISDAQIDAALLICFPSGSKNVDDGEKLRVVFRHFKQQNSEHKQRT